MADKLSPSRRSWNMSRIPSKNTRTELQVRSLIHSMGLRYRLHSKKLPGKPDLVFPKYKTVIFVNGCFWHRHKGCKITTTPKTNTKFWKNKFSYNVARDKEHQRELLKLGWNVVVVWQCELKDKKSLTEKVSDIFSKTI
jgi:DNA mismatch endonuclease (patch repair protein)